jgi:hypothetical protein
MVLMINTILVVVHPNPLWQTIATCIKQDTDYFGGFLTFIGAYRSNGKSQNEIGADLKKSMAKPGDWKVYMSMQGETIPKETNHVRLSNDQKDEWEFPY